MLLTESPILDGAGRMVGTSTIAHDISDLMHAEEGWHSSEELFQNALEFAPFGMCLTSLDGVFLRVNPTLSRMLGRQEEELLAMSWPSLTHPDDLAVSQSAERDLVDGKVPSVEFEKRYVHRDGNIIWVRVRDFLAKNSQGVSTGFVTHIEDITERRRAAEELRRAKEAAEGASLAKSEFLANMSHEIRTPMNGILGTTELALASELDAQQREWLGMAHDCAESLMAILNDILDLSKIESGRLELETEPLHIRREIQRAVNIVLPIASRKGLAVEAMVEPDVPECVLGDSVRLRQVLVNLLGNAVKFTRSGLVKVRARSESRGDALCLYFSVTDTGIGIPAAEQAAIFEPFRQADNSIVRSYGGTGLGLSICNRLVGLMGGWIGRRERIWRGQHVLVHGANGARPGSRRRRTGLGTGRAHGSGGTPPAHPAGRGQRGEPDGSRTVVGETRPLRACGRKRPRRRGRCCR